LVQENKILCFILLINFVTSHILQAFQHTPYEQASKLGPYDIFKGSHDITNNKNKL